MTLYCVKFIDVKTPAVMIPEQVLKFSSMTEQALWQIEKSSSVKIVYTWLEASVRGGVLQAHTDGR